MYLVHLLEPVHFCEQHKSRAQEIEDHEQDFGSNAQLQQILLLANFCFRFFNCSNLDYINDQDKKI